MSHILVALFVAHTFGQVETAKTNQEADPERVQYQRWMGFYQQEAAACSISIDDNTRTELQFHPDPVLKWTNPTRANQIHGAVFVWTHQGRPEVMGSIWSNVTTTHPDKRTVGQQFHSLSERPLIAQKRGEQFWDPRTAGIDPQPIADAPVPAKTAALRLVQMRALARQFRGEGREYNVDRDIRLLTQPLYRQEHPAGDVLDGALFVFAMGTDPELILLIEARQTGDGPRWHFSAGRFTGMQLRLLYRDVEVWSYQGRAQQFDPKKPYLSMYSVMIREKEIE